MMSSTTFNVAGLTFRQKETPELLNARPSGKVAFRAEPDNAYDPKAIAIYWLNVHIGYVPSDDTQKRKAVASGAQPFLVQSLIHEKLDTDGSFYGEIDDFSFRDGDEWTGKDGGGVLGAVTVRVDIDAPQDTANVHASMTFQDEPAGVELVSFNEPGVVVEFEELPHVYRYQGNVLTSATDLTEKCVKPFPIDFVAPKVAKKYGISEAEVRMMWRQNGDVASKFGDAVHLALDNYCRFREKCGEKALPKHPFLREIVLSFPWTHDLEEYSEVLVTCVGRGLCGTSDRIVVDQDGVCWVEDLKVKFGVEETSSKDKNLLIPEAPSNKLGLAQVQMSVYCEMLELAGKTVGDTVTAHVWGDTQQWEAFKMPRIKGVLDRLTGKGE